jgi:hypothetical protein
LGEGQGALAVTMDQNFPYVLLVNVTVDELQRLRDKAEELFRKFCSEPSDNLRVVEENEAVFFCFKNSNLAVLFEAYCCRNRICHRRFGDGNWYRAR